MGLSHIEWILLRLLVQSAVGENVLCVLDLQNLALEHSCLASAIEAVRCWQGSELGSLKVTVNCLDAETGELVLRGVGSGLLEARPPVQQSSSWF